MSGPLDGIRIVELAGIGPGPFAAMALSDAGADIIRIDRVPDANAIDDPLLAGRAANVLNRGRRSIAVDLKDPRARDFILDLVARADGLIEGFRPGVTERLGIGPTECLERNPRLVYGRVTGYGRAGSYAMAAGHDIDYIALSGTLSAIGPAGAAPEPPLNLVGDFGGGGLLLAFGMTSALLEACRSGLGQVVDTAMIDGAAYLATSIHGLRALGLWDDERGSNILDGGAPFYEIYTTSDQQYLAVGSIEEKFFRELLDLLDLNDVDVPRSGDRSQWPEIHERLAAKFGTRTRDEWETLFAGTDACVAPVLTMAEAPNHPHVAEWGTFVTFDDVTQPAPAPRFSRTPGVIRRSAPRPGQGGVAALRDWGFQSNEVQELIENGIINADDGSD
jgi:alpha-methylacyl-CoA racemase